MRKYVLAGICPFCGLGPWKMLAGHTSKSHAVDRFELREMAGLFYTSILTSPEFHAERSELAKRNFGRFGQAEKLRTGRAQGPHRLSPAAKALNAEKSRNRSPAAKAATTERLRRYRRENPDIGHLAGAAAAASKAKRMDPLYRQIVATYEEVLAERTVTYGAIIETGRRLGLNPATARRRLNVAWRQGYGTFDRPPRRINEDRPCSVCGVPFTVKGESDRTRRTCSRTCGSREANATRKRPPRTGVCKICATKFTYERPGTKPRLLCGSKDCAVEMSRRTGSRTPSEETRRRISEGKKRAARETRNPGGDSTMKLYRAQREDSRP